MVDQDSVLSKMIDKATEDFFENGIDYIEVNIVDKGGNEVAYDNIFPDESDYKDLLWKLRDRPGRVIDDQIAEMLQSQYDRNPENFDGYYNKVSGKKGTVDYDNE